MTILSSTPTGRPDVAPLDEEFDYDKLTNDIEEALSELGQQYAPRMAEWREWIDARPKTQADLASCSSLPNWGDWPRRPVEGASTVGAGPAEIVRSIVLASSVTMCAPRRITSPVGDGSEGAAASKANNQQGR